MRNKYKKMSVAQLIEKYIAIGVRQYDDIIVGNVASFNKLFDIDLLIISELESRGRKDDISVLLNHQNPQVRYNTAKAIRHSRPAEARLVFEEFAAQDYHPLQPHCRRTLDIIDGRSALTGVS